MPPKPKGQRRRSGSWRDEGRGANPLSLTSSYRDNPAPFARPGPPPTPPLPLKATCRKCRAKVPLDSGSCPSCGELFYWH